MTTAPAQLPAPPFRLITLIALGATLLGCGDGRVDSGIAVGNPGSMRATAGHAEGVALRSVSFSASQALLRPCGSAGTQPIGGSDTWPAAGVPIPEGDWCSLELKGSRISVAGDTPSNGFRFEAKPKGFSLEFDAPPLADEPSLLVIGGLTWLQADMFENNGEELILDEKTDEVEALLAAMGPSILLIDRDADGRVSPADEAIEADMGPEPE